MVGLFQEARAANMDWTSVDTSPSGTTDYTFQLSIPNDQDLPISHIGASIEKNNPNYNGKRGATTTAFARCPMSPVEGMDCTASGSGANKLEFDYDSSVITRIKMDRVFEKSSDRDLVSGYTQDCGNDDCYFSSSGYGYDGSLQHLGSGYSSEQWRDTGIGYGYGYDVGVAEATVGSGYLGYGYNQGGSGTLVFQFTVTIDTDQLEQGTQYWISGIVETGTDIIGSFTTLDQSFTPTTSSTPGGSSGGPGTSSGGLLEVDVGEEFDVDADQTVKLTGNLPNGIKSIGLNFNKECNDCTVSVSRSKASPSGASQMTPGFRAVYFLDIQVKDSDGNEIDGYVDDGWIEFDVDQDELPGEANPPQIVLLRDNNGWKVQVTDLLSDEDADPLNYNATIEGFSFFAIVADEQPPTVTNNQPTGSTSSVTPQIRAEWSDNQGIDTDSLVLTIDGTSHGDDTGSLTTTENRFSFVPAEALTKGEHTVTVEISDDAGLTTTKEWSFRVSEVTCPQPPRITKVEPAPDATDVPVDATVRVFVQKGSCPIATSTLTINGEDVGASLDGNVLTATLSDVGFEETVSARATITDTGENTARRGWSFTTAQEDVTPPPPSDEGISGWVWVIIALIVIGIVAAGVYFYNEQQG